MEASDMLKAHFIFRNLQLMLTLLGMVVFTKCSKLYQIYSVECVMKKGLFCIQLIIGHSNQFVCDF